MTDLANNRAAVVRLPGLAALPAFAVAGFSRRFEEGDKSAIPQLWSLLMERLPFEGQAESWTTYGLVWSVDPTDGGFNYMAGAALKPGAAAPEGLTRLDVAAARYAVFRITLAGGDLHPQVQAAMAAIWGELMPASGLKVKGGPDFERYDGDFRPDRPGAVIDFHVPVEA